MKNPGFDFRFTLRYLLSLAICAASIYVYIIYDWNSTTEQIIDENPITVTLKKGTVLADRRDVNDHSKICELPKTVDATILGMSISNHNVLVATEDGWRGFVDKKDIPEGAIPEDHAFPGFNDELGLRYSSSIEGFEGKRLEELESELGFATAIIPSKEGFTAIFRIELYNSADHNVYYNPGIRFIDSLAVDTVLNAATREWSWTQWNPFFRIPLWLGYKTTPEQWKGHMSLQDSGNRSIDIWYSSDNGFWQAIVNIALFFLYISIIFFIIFRLPILPVYPLITFVKYNYHFDADTTIGILFIIFAFFYITVTPFITIVLSTGIWNLIWFIIILGGGMYVFSKLSQKVEENKCPSCNRYDSYELTDHVYSHTTIEQRSRQHTTNETRRGTTSSGESVNVNVRVHHTTYYDVEVKHFNDTYTCRYCGNKKYTTSTEETEI